MKKFSIFSLLLLAGSLLLTGCLHITEEVTQRANGSGTYKLVFDLSEMKSMVDMVKAMAPDSAQADAGGMGEMGNPMSMLGMKGEDATLLNSIKSVQGITNVTEVNDTTNFMSTFSFDYANAEALNSAIRIMFKDRFDKKVENAYEAGKKKFERNSTADLGTLFRTLLDEAGQEAGEEGEAEGMGDMASMFFSTMTYKQVYVFPDRTVKKSSNPLSEISEDRHKVTIEIKPFDKEQQEKKPTIATEISLKK